MNFSANFWKSFSRAIALLIALVVCWHDAEAQSLASNRLTRPGTNSLYYAGSSQSRSSSSVQLRTPENAQGLNLDRSLIDTFKQSPPSSSLKAVFTSGANESGLSSARSQQQSGGTGLWAAPTMAQLKRISDHDVVVAIDKSGSMSTTDCPGDIPTFLRQFLFGGPPTGLISRWQWCQRQTMYFTSQLSRVPGSNIKLILFDTRVSQFDNVSLRDLPGIFNRFDPFGGTNTTGAIKAAINDYFQRKKTYGTVRPLLIVCITDGAPDNSRSLKDLIVNTTTRVESQGEITIVFLQVGDDREGNRLLPELAYGLPSEGAQYNIVSYRDFGSLLRTGLLNALIDVVNSQVPANRP